MDLGNTWAGPGYTGTPKDTTIINHMMLRFRPIAPKPVANSSGPGTTPETLVVGKRRTKRKYVRVKKNDKCKINKKEKSDGSSDDHQTVVTLQLLPESSGGVKSLPENRSYPKTINFFVQDRSSIWINNNILSIGAPDPSDRTSVEIRSPMVVESWVMVDGLTNTTLVDLSALGSTDMEKMMNLQRDTCPGFISDGLDSVKWVNLAYRRMIDPVDDGGEAPEMAVRLVVKENKSAALLLLPSFACIVRIVYTWNKVKQSRTMPCDVWKMDFGGFAWKFDAKAALSLGR